MHYKLAALSLLAVITSGVVIMIFYTMSRPTTMIFQDASAANENSQPRPEEFTHMGGPFLYASPRAGNPRVTPMNTPDGVVEHEMH